MEKQDMSWNTVFLDPLEYVAVLLSIGLIDNNVWFLSVRRPLTTWSIMTYEAK